MEAFSLGVREKRGGVHKTGVGGCIHRMIRANRLKVSSVGDDLGHLGQKLELVGHNRETANGIVGEPERRFGKGDRQSE